MLQRTSIRAKTGILLVALLLLAGCNLSTALPTPTLPPATVQPVTIDGRDTPAPPVLATATATLDTSCPAARADWVIYVVQDGDSLADLAVRTNSTVTDLVNVNCLTDPDAIYSGQSLLLPQPPAP